MYQYGNSIGPLLFAQDMSWLLPATERLLSMKKNSWWWVASVSNMSPNPGHIKTLWEVSWLDQKLLCDGKNISYQYTLFLGCFHINHMNNLGLHKPKHATLALKVNCEGLTEARRSSYSLVS